MTVEVFIPGLIFAFIVFVGVIIIIGMIILVMDTHLLKKYLKTRREIILEEKERDDNEV